ncbi:helicase HerA-like domain-containing protein [Nocardioides sp. NPDC057764]|uniref:ATP-binding protein n=1 Tax=Nocardioides sp. NPDC057764 TaxID=3346243 RepID=UPI00366D5EE7
MPANQLKIATGLSLDADYIAGASLALLGKRGAGKTYACRVLAEALFDAHVQTVIVDPMGVFWGLRASADGEQEGLPIPVFGGEHGDAPLESSAGALMADLVVEEGLSMILDLSGFGSRTQERTFTAAFLDRLYRANKDLVHLIVDEADLFAPQKPRREDAHLLVTMENIVRRGRNKGIGITMATQRAAVLNKDVLTQIDGLVALRVAAPQDRDAIRDWVRGQGDEATWSRIAPSLPSLANGECWWWIPEKEILKEVQVRKTRTFDSSPTRTRGHSNRTPKTFADVDLAAISGQIAATIERAKATDPRELTRRIKELERELEKALDTSRQNRAAPEPEVVEVPVLDEALVARFEDATKTLTQRQATADDAFSDLLEHVLQAHEDAKQSSHQVIEAIGAIGSSLANAPGLPKAPTAPAQPPRAPRAAPSPPQAKSRPIPAPDPAPSSSPVAPSTNTAPSSGNAGGMSPARQRLLDALAGLEDIGIEMARKTQLALWAGVSPKSSGFANNLGALRTAGLIEYPAPSHVGLTDDGRALTQETELLANNDELHRKVQTLVTPARWRILAALIEAYPDSLPKDALAEAAGVSAASSGYANNLGALRSLGLLDYPSPGFVAATPVLFLSEA